MNSRRLIFYGLGLFLVFGTALATTYFGLEHFVYSRRSLPAGVMASHPWAHQIGLNKDQEAKLEPMEATLQKDLDGIQLKLARERLVLCSLMHKGSKDSQELDQYINRVGALEAEQQRRVVRHLLAMRDILTPEQKDKFFTAIMEGICQGCRASLKMDKDMCGMCPIQKG